MGLGFERMTVFCRNLDASLHFYRDLLGLVAVEEKVIEGASAGALLQLPACRIHIVFLAADADADSILGLFEIGQVELGSICSPEGRPAHGQTAIVLSTTAFEALRKKLEAAKVRFLTPALRYPKHQANERSPAGLYREMICYDPDGILVSIMQIDPLGAENAA